MNSTNISRDAVAAAIEQCASCAIVVLSPRGTVEMWSLGAQQLSGWTCDEAVGKPLSFWLAGLGDEDAQLRSWLAQVAEHGWIELVTRRRRAEGSEVIVQSTLGPVRDGPHIVGLIDVARELPSESAPDAGRPWQTTPQEAQLHAQKLESLGVMAGGIAHDFNNLLTAILGNASLVLRDMPGDSASRERLQDIHDAARRASRLTRQLLAYSGKAKFEVRPLDLSSHVNEIAHLMRSCISKKSELRLQLASTMPAIHADVAQLQQVVMNLVVNASEAIGEDTSGSITVTTGVTTITQDASCHLLGGVQLAAGDYAYLSVSDTGCGIPEAIRERIFDPFFTTKFQGRGLGLAAVLGIMRTHNGALGLETRTGVGSCFTAYFPTIASPPEYTVRTGVFRFRGAGRVLVVDDEDCVRSVARKVLCDLGFEVVEAENGAAGVRLIEEDPDAFVAVLLDVAMPVMGGAEAFARIRRIRPDLPVVMTSGYSESTAVERLHPDRPSGFLSKPYTAARFAEVFMTVFGGAPKGKRDGA